MFTLITAYPKTYPIKLLYSNNSIDDIILFDQLEQYRLDPKRNFSVEYAITAQSEELIEQNKYFIDKVDVDRYFIEMINQKLIKQRLLDAFWNNDKMLILLCGPPVMNQFMKKYLAELNYDMNYVITF